MLTPPNPQVTNYAALPVQLFSRFWRRGVHMKPVFVRLFGSFQSRFCLIEAIATNAMRGWRVKALFKELFERHPPPLVLNPATPGADLHEFFQILHVRQNTTGRTSHNKPDPKNEQDLEDRLTKIGNIGLIAEEQGG